jgi:hypothetical protein
LLPRADPHVGVIPIVQWQPRRPIPACTGFRSSTASFNVRRPQWSNLLNTQRGNAELSRCWRCQLIVVSTWSPNLRPLALHVTTCVSVGPKSCGRKAYVGTFTFYNTIRGCCGQSEVAKRSALYWLPDKKLCPQQANTENWFAKGLILALLNLDYQLGFDDSISNRS